MNVLIVCEFSGRVREAFRLKGHNAWSVDLLPSEIPGNHIQGDIRDMLISEGDWDLMIAHPPCQYLSVSGVHWNKRVEGRNQLTENALEFVQWLMDLPIDKICVENPVSIISTRIRKPDQIIQPFQFGHPESKKTCLWLKGLDKLTPTDILPLPECGYWENQTPSKQNKLGPSVDRAKNRGRTYMGIAEAMAEQWG